MPLKTPLSTLDYELAEEQAGTLGQLGRALEAALAALKAADPKDRTLVRQLNAAAGEALWYFLIQREALGLRDERRVIATFGVPPQVVAMMGISAHPPENRAHAGAETAS